MKRKADSESDLHNGLFLKSLKRSVSDFICENDAGLAVLSEKYFLNYFLSFKLFCPGKN